MKRFITKLFLFAVVFMVFSAILLLTGIFIIGPQYIGTYQASLIDKVARLKSINEPKIILATGSNFAFGINSPMLQQAMNMPVVNMGLHSGFGNAFNENMMKLNLNSGDIVVVGHLIFSDDNTIQDNALMWRTIEYDKELWEIVRPRDYLDMLRAWPDYVWHAFIDWITGGNNYEPPYSRSAFNEFGDVVNRPEEARKTLEVLLKERKLRIHDINDTCINRLNELNNYVTERGAVLLVAGYPIISVDITPPKEKYDEFTRELSERLSCDVISEYRDYFIPAKYFYDTIFHLDKEGADIRTSQLIKDLKNWQARHK